MLKTLSVIALALLVSACASTPAAVETRWKTITVTKRGPCPAPTVYEKLKASRPTPLRNQAKPASAVERGARTSAQLGLYEAEGKWADQVQSALDRCQVEGSETESAEGVAEAP